MNVLFYIIMAIYAVLGGGTTIAITGYRFVVLGQKIYRKIRYNTPLYS